MCIDTMYEYVGACWARCTYINIGLSWKGPVGLIANHDFSGGKYAHICPVCQNMPNLRISANWTFWGYDINLLPSSVHVSSQSSIPHTCQQSEDLLWPPFSSFPHFKGKKAVGSKWSQDLQPASHPQLCKATRATNNNHNNVESCGFRSNWITCGTCARPLGCVHRGFLKKKLI